MLLNTSRSRWLRSWWTEIRPVKLETWLFERNIKFVIFKSSVNKMTIEVGAPEREIDLFKLNSSGPVAVCQD